MEVQWRIIPYYPKYSVSHTGSIKNNITNRVLKYCVRNGYASVSLCKNSTKNTVNIHQIVADLFLEKPDNIGIKYVVNHKNENKLDNHIDNLEYTTYGYNTAYSKTDKHSKNTDIFDLTNFKDIPGYTLYQISSKGEIYSKKVKRLCCITKLPSGYCKIKLKSDNNVYHDRYIHVLVAMTYLDYIPSSRSIVINHKDGCKHNNYSTNLEIVTQKENMKHSITLNCDRIFRKAVYYYDETKNKIIYDSAKSASLSTGIDHSSIIKSCKSDTKCAGKIKWFYDNEML